MGCPGGEASIITVVVPDCFRMLSPRAVEATPIAPDHRARVCPCPLPETPLVVGFSTSARQLTTPLVSTSLYRLPSEIEATRKTWFWDGVLRITSVASVVVAVHVLSATIGPNSNREDVNRAASTDARASPR